MYLDFVMYWCYGDFVLAEELIESELRVIDRCGFKVREYSLERVIELIMEDEDESV
jgi:hypothetical protein